MSVSQALGEQHEVKLGQGAIRYRERGSGDPVVLVHGVLVNGDLWREVAPRLADQGHRVIVPDLPLGSHSLPFDEDADLTPPGLARLIDEFMGALGLEGVTLVGNDTGGALSQLVAVNHPARLGRLVLTPCDAFEHFFPALFKYLSVAARIPGAVAMLSGSAKLKAVRRSPIAFGWLMKKDPPKEVVASWTDPLGDAAIRRDVVKVLRSIDKRHTLDAADRLGGFARPTLIAWAARDRVFPLADARKLAELLPDARLRTIEDSYSFVPEDQPEELTRLVAEFIRETQPVTGAA